MKSKIGVILLVLAACIALGTAVAHMSCIFLGPECYAVQLAPAQVIASAVDGTYLAPISTICVSIIFVILALYALSGAGIIRKLPLLHYGIYAVAMLCIIRGILPLQLWLRHPDKVNDMVFYAGVLWLVTGLFFLFGYRLCSKQRISN